MNNNIQESYLESKEIRSINNGPGEEVAREVESTDQQVNSQEGKKKYQREATFNQDRYNIPGMYADGYKVETEEDGSMVVPNDYVKPGERQMFGFEFAEDSHRVEPFSTSRMLVGGALDALKGTSRLIGEATEGWPDPGNAAYLREGIENWSPEWLDKSSGVLEDIGRDLTQFGTGYAGAYKMLGGMGMKSLLGKDVAASIAGGQTFDPSEGSLGTLAADFDMMPEMLRFLDSKYMTEEYGQLAGRVSLALEEAGIGAGVYGVRKILSGVKGRYRAYGEEMMRTGVIKYRKATGTINGTNGQVGADKLLDNEAAEEAMNQIATGFQMKGGTIDDFTELAEQSGLTPVQAKQAWNAAAKEKMSLIQSVLTDTSGRRKTIGGSQRGSIDLAERTDSPVISVAAELIEDTKVYSVDDLKGFFQNQVSKGNVQAAEYQDVVKPMFDQYIGMDQTTGKFTGADIKDYMYSMIPEFKTKTLSGNDAKFADNPIMGDANSQVFDPQRVQSYNDLDEGGRGIVEQMNELVEAGDIGKEEADRLVAQSHEMPSNLDIDDMYSTDYKEHLFISQNPYVEGAGGLVGPHFQDKHIKGWSRTSFMTDPDTGVKQMNMVQEFQSDYATAAQKLGTFSDTDLDSAVSKVKAELEKLPNEERMYGLSAPDITEVLAKELYGPEEGAKLQAQIMKDLLEGHGAVNHMSKKAEALYNIADNMAENGSRYYSENLRASLPSVSPYNKNKAWVRQTMRPVIEDSIANGVNKISLVSSDIIFNRTGGVGPHDKYLKEYPKIMKRYLMDIGVPEKDIHMPKNSSESFWAELPREWVGNPRNPLPAYSMAGAPLVGHQMGNEE